ncbi:MAG: AAA family ATPase [Calditerrivibrio sp.]|nr:AAA family ATPase [Calditerrivibrio sp.]MCA1933198.1 AAA family ATPase [Calditerrivibrio sp.]MCA1980003.1 AAA family ATPase [Calditerrivibrio sp.]
MSIESIYLKNFRNHILKKFQFDEKNFIVGKNGSGKTSIVEAIYIVFSGRSFRTNRLRNAINNNHDFFELNGRLSEEGISIPFKLTYKTGKEFFIDKKKVENSTEFILKHPIVCYSPENEGFLSDEMEVRRRFLDRLIGYVYPQHIVNLKSYLKLLNIKKSYIHKKIKDPLLYSSIHEKMIFFGNRISSKRVEFIEKFNSIIDKNINDFPTFLSENFSLKFAASEIHVSLIDSEIAKGMVLTGPHRDKISFLINGKICENFASFGQRKSLSLFCIYCFIKVVEEFLKYGIIVILDDLEAGLDAERVKFFLEKIKPSQLFITGLPNNTFEKFNTINIE